MIIFDSIPLCKGVSELRYVYTSECEFGLLKAEVVEFLVAVRFFMVLAPNPSGQFLVI